MNDNLPSLPEFDPSPDLWARIETELRADTSQPDTPLRRAIDSLPTYEPKLDLWTAIDADLNRSVVTRSLWASKQLRWGSLAAAAVLLLVGGWLLLTLSNTEHVHMEYAVERTAKPTSAAELPALDNATADQRAEEFIRRQCEEQQLACQRPDVHELRNQLTELTQEQQRLAQERQTFGDDPVLIRAQVQVENQRIEVLKELITMLRS